MGVTEHCVSDFIANKTQARKALINSIASNIYDSLSGKNEIADLMKDMLNPANSDKDELMKTLMTKINSTLEDSLQKKKKCAPAILLNNENNAESVAVVKRGQPSECTE